MIKRLETLSVLPCLILTLSSTGCFKQTSLQFNDLKAAEKFNRSPASEYDVNALVAPRGYVESVLIQAFNIPESDATTREDLKNKIYLKGEFGGECDFYAASETNDKQTEFPREICSEDKGLTIEGRAISNPARFALTSEVCESLAATKLDSAMGQVILNWASNANKPVPDSAGVIKVFQLFHRNTVPNEKVITALLNTSKTGSNNTEAWRNIVINVCISPSWQFL
jgi:hypothetical protein